MRKNKTPEFILLLEQFLMEYMPLSSGFSPNTVRSYKHSFRLLFQYIYQTKKKEADAIRFRDLEETGRAGQQETYIFSSQTHPQITISCIEEIYKKYIAIARAAHPEMFLEKSYTPHTMRHTTATHMLEAGVPIVAIKNFLGHSSISTTERYAELSQGTVNRHIRGWNEKWFSHQKENRANHQKENPLPDFLK